MPEQQTNQQGRSDFRRADDGVLGLSANLFMFQILRRLPFRACRTVRRTLPSVCSRHHYPKPDVEGRSDRGLLNSELPAYAKRPTDPFPCGCSQLITLSRDRSFSRQCLLHFEAFKFWMIPIERPRGFVARSLPSAFTQPQKAVFRCTRAGVRLSVPPPLRVRRA